MTDHNLYCERPTKEWFAAYTIVRHEKAVNAALGEKGIETFLPLTHALSRWKDRIKKVQFPLFPGYLFIRSNASFPDRFIVLNTSGVVRVLGIGADPIPVPDEQIHAIRVLLDSQVKYDSDEYYQGGKEAIVVHGPLRGIRGMITERRGTFRLILSIDMIQRSVAAEVDIRDVAIL